MPQTPNSAASPYVSNAIALDMYSPDIVANMLRPFPSAPDPSYLAMVDTANPAGARWLTHLKIGAGEIEAACTVARRYSPADLAALDGVSKMWLQKLNAARGFWSLAMYLKPLTARPEEVPMARESFEMLKLLQAGEWIFGLLESAEAGLPHVQGAQPSRLLTPNVVATARRLFPSFGPNRINNNGSTS